MGFASSASNALRKFDPCDRFTTRLRPHCTSLLFQVKLKISVQNMTTTCADLDFIFRIIRNGSCNTIQSCTNEVTTGKKNCHKI